MTQLPEIPAMASLRARFLARCAEDAEQIRDAARRQGYGEVGALAHRMVGAAGSLGEDGIAEIARQMSAAARGGDGPALATLVATLESILRARPRSLP